MDALIEIFLFLLLLVVRNLEMICHSQASYVWMELRALTSLGWITTIEFHEFTAAAL
jgi:hypothetical protein